MNLIEAIKSGRKFKHKHRTDWLSPHPENIVSYPQLELISDDWEIEPEPSGKVFHSFEIKHAICSSMTLAGFSIHTPVFLDELARQLGFTE